MTSRWSTAAVADNAFFTARIAEEKTTQKAEGDDGALVVIGVLALSTFTAIPELAVQSVGVPVRGLAFARAAVKTATETKVGESQTWGLAGAVVSIISNTVSLLLANWSSCIWRKPCHKLCRDLCGWNLAWHCNTRQTFCGASTESLLLFCNRILAAPGWSVRCVMLVHRNVV